MLTSKIVSKDRLMKFEFTQEIIDGFRKAAVIPVDFYNKEGQVLIHKQDNANSDDFGRLLKFAFQGIFFLKDDLKRLMSFGEESVDKTQIRSKLIDQQKTIAFAKRTNALIDDLRKSSLSSNHAVFIHNSINELLTDFIKNPEYETGIINVVEIMGKAGVSLESEMMTKRTIVAMGMKVRNRKVIQNADQNQDKKDHLNLMMASYLLDIGYTRMNLKENPKLSAEDYATIQQHPIISYLMSLTAPEVSTYVRTMILNHHRPYRGIGVNNNYPDQRVIFNRLMAIRDKYSKETNKERIVTDIQNQIGLIANDVTSTNMEEDVAILSLASEFSSLTSEQSWRQALAPEKALKLILNESFFSYSNRNIRHLIDYVGSSLTNNISIINANDFVITASMDSERSVHFDICKVVSVARYQTRPLLQRIGTIKPIIKKDNKYKIVDFDRTQIKVDRRKANFDLEKTVDSTRIIYLVDKEINPPLYDCVYKLQAS
ncbi:c-di-GMP phosphodiesterase [Leptospira sp. GIMC2001]|uniref:c-di-GMP phosphodiesterase n=1 Tax=Leptospira sp. GIMC2001 TaxID=1513297 RepID=UPI002348FC54|nr:c-di-GMP phosphodiesterase [Leptospira sp. GIMC2001]WCL49248.1 c-di-GMP phosphodiesterase [Leptospira sp. GIMC2001]